MLAQMYLYSEIQWTQNVYVIKTHIILFVLDQAIVTESISLQI